MVYGSLVLCSLHYPADERRLPYQRALAISNRLKVTERLYPLFVHGIVKYLYRPSAPPAPTRASLPTTTSPREHKMDSGTNNSVVDGNQSRVARGPSETDERPTFRLPPLPIAQTVVELKNEAEKFLQPERTAPPVTSPSHHLTQAFESMSLQTDKSCPPLFGVADDFVQDYSTYEAPLLPPIQPREERSENSRFRRIVCRYPMVESKSTPDSSSSNPLSHPSGGTTALQDYQEQLMALEAQNKHRISNGRGSHVPQSDPVHSSQLANEASPPAEKEPVCNATEPAIAPNNRKSLLTPHQTSFTLTLLKKSRKSQHYHSTHSADALPPPPPPRTSRVSKQPARTPRRAQHLQIP